MTPIQYKNGIFIKREDLFEVAGCKGSKARACWEIATNDKNKDKLKNGLITAGSRKSPQVNIVSHIAKQLGVYCEAHTPMGELSLELIQAKELGATIVQHKAGYNNVIKKRARDSARELNALEIPFGMECEEAVEQTARQVESIKAIKEKVKRIVITIGSGINVAGLLRGLKREGIKIEVLGIRVGADPTKILDKYAPFDWREMITIKTAKEKYHEEVEAVFGGILLDPVYEAKCLKYLKEGDLFWIIGVRNMVKKQTNKKMRISNYLSFSQYDAFNTGQYLDRYILGKRLSSPYIDLGKQVAENLESGKETYGLPIPKEREALLVADFSGITLLGYADGLSVNENEIIIDEIKTSTTEWTQVKVDKHEQLTFYAIMTSIIYKEPIEKIRIRLHWLETYKDTDGKIKLSGRKKSLETKRTKLDMIKIYPKVKKAWEGIGKLTKENKGRKN